MVTIKSNVKKQTFQKVIVSNISATLLSVKLIANRRYRTIREIAKAIGVNMPPRKGFAFLDKNNTIALYCVQIGGNTKWNNTLNSDEKTLIENNTGDKTPAMFQKRVCNSYYYNVNTRRLLFVKENGYYRYVGVFRVAAFDFEAMNVVMNKDFGAQLKFKVTTRKTVTIITEETSIDIEINK